MKKLLWHGPIEVASLQVCLRTWWLIHDTVHSITLETILTNAPKAAWFIEAFGIWITSGIPCPTLIDICDHGHASS